MANANNPSSATPVSISALVLNNPSRSSSLVDAKIRIAGMALSYDYEHQILLVHDNVMHACLVDTSLILDSLIRIPTLRGPKTVITVIGYLERVEDGLSIPVIPAFIDAPVIDPTLILRAILISPSPDLNLQLWEQSVRLEEETLIDGLGSDVS